MNTGIYIMCGFFQNLFCLFKDQSFAITTSNLNDIHCI